MPHETMTIDECAVEEKDTGDRKECSTCIWWNRMRPTPETVELWGMEMFAFGECRGVPPTALSGDKKQVAQNDPTQETFVIIKQARFPHTYHDDWCGMWTAGV